jgi:aspartyl-tRNA(Asn)/glutamyl-tRNA(Gln) amidotransferase subunit A
VDLTSLSIAEAATLYRRGETSPEEVTRACLSEIDKRESSIHAFATVTSELAIKQARAAHKAIAEDPCGNRPLLGIPICLKDLIETAGIATTASSRVLAGNVPASDAPVWRRLRRAGAVLVGKSHTHEFAYGSVTPTTRNPWNPERIPGGSSGGSAAAVAAGFCLGAVGTDTAGSIRIPSGLCGVVGLKPTYGLVPKSGVIALSWSLDHVGPLARSPVDTALLLDAMAGFERSDPASVRRGKAGSYVPAPNESTIDSLRIGAIANTGAVTSGVAAGFDAATAALADMGAEPDEVTIEGWETAVEIDFTILGVEASVYHEENLKQRSELFTDDVRKRLEWGLTLDGASYVKATLAAARFRDSFEELLARYDLLVCPGMPCPAPVASARTVSIRGQEHGIDHLLCRNTAMFNLTGLPALAVPSGFEDGLPVGIQVIGGRWQEKKVIQMGRLLQDLLARGKAPLIPDRDVLKTVAGAPQRCASERSARPAGSGS